MNLLDLSERKEVNEEGESYIWSICLLPENKMVELYFKSLGPRIAYKSKCF